MTLKEVFMEKTLTYKMLDSSPNENGILNLSVTIYQQNKIVETINSFPVKVEKDSNGNFLVGEDLDLYIKKQLGAVL